MLAAWHVPTAWHAIAARHVLAAWHVLAACRWSLSTQSHVLTRPQKVLLRRVLLRSFVLSPCLFGLEGPQTLVAFRGWKGVILGPFESARVPGQLRVWYRNVVHSESVLSTSDHFYECSVLRSLALGLLWGASRHRCRTPCSCGWFCGAWLKRRRPHLTVM